MPTINNNLEIFDNQGQVFPSLSTSNVSTMGFDYFDSQNQVFPYLLQPAVQISAPIIVSSPPKRRIFIID